jgi:hypothetical protein
MLSLVSLIVSIGATVVGKVVLYRDFPKELRPGLFGTVFLGAGFLFFLYCITRALIAFFGKS